MLLFLFDDFGLKIWKSDSIVIDTTIASLDISVLPFNVNNFHPFRLNLMREGLPKKLPLGKLDRCFSFLNYLCRKRSIFLAFTGGLTFCE